jgi:hypothetical protein
VAQSGKIEQGKFRPLPLHYRQSGVGSIADMRTAACLRHPAAGPGAPACQPVPNQFFDPNAFVQPPPQALGKIGNAPRSICCGPGISNADLALLKTTRLAEHKELQFRAEFFNAFNHAQFYVPDGNITDGSTFGQVAKARDPRLIQLALKLLF